MKVVFTEAAAGDVFRLRAFIEEKAPGAAKKAVTAIIRGCASLSTFPERGAVRSDGLRQLVVAFGAAGYIVRYRVDQDAEEVVVIRIKHGKEAP
ncbi:MAG: type II toxin-antitoxin system RelE/ParE family toxin [Alphaproteobacteria bacterium]|nr:type II toxin-antitoxin system RelE/ParE family toxin [Alphaproteobacteria bacterium]